MSKDGTQVLSVLAPLPTVFGIMKQPLQHLILGKPSRALGTAPVRVLGLGHPRWSGTVGRSASDPVKGALVMLGPRRGLGPKVQRRGGVIARVFRQHPALSPKLYFTLSLVYIKTVWCKQNIEIRFIRDSLNPNRL